MDTRLDCSVVIATAGDASDIGIVVEALTRQRNHDAGVKVIVVDNNRKPELSGRLADLVHRPGVRLVSERKPGAAAARNAGVRVAEGEVVVFIDDDIHTSPEFIASHLAAHADINGPVVAVGRIVEHNRRGGWFRRYLDERRVVNRAPDPAGVDFRDVYGANVSITRSLYDEVGGFDEEFLRREDTELGYRLQKAGATFVYVPGAVGEHHSSFGPLDHLRRARLTGYSLAMLIEKHPRTADYERMDLYRPWKRWLGLLGGLPMVAFGFLVYPLTPRALFLGMTGLTLFRASSGFHEYQRNSASAPTER